MIFFGNCSELVEGDNSDVPFVDIGVYELDI